MSYWFEQMAEIKDRKYAQQIAFLRENHGFSQAHANALVLYSRGSTTSRKYATLDEYLAPFDEVKQATVRRILDAVQSMYPTLELVIAWNKPMLKSQDRYVFGVAVATRHLLIAPFNAEVIDEMRPRLTDYVVNKKTIQVPVDWVVDANLLRELVASALADRPS